MVKTWPFQFFFFSPATGKIKSRSRQQHGNHTSPGFSLKNTRGRKKNKKNWLSHFGPWNKTLNFLCFPIFLLYIYIDIIEITPKSFFRRWAIGFCEKNTWSKISKSRCSYHATWNVWHRVGPGASDSIGSKDVESGLHPWCLTLVMGFIILLVNLG